MIPKESDPINGMHQGVKALEDQEIVAKSTRLFEEKSTKNSKGLKSRKKKSAKSQEWQEKLEAKQSRKGK